MTIGTRLNFSPTVDFAGQSISDPSTASKPFARIKGEEIRTGRAEISFEKPQEETQEVTSESRWNRAAKAISTQIFGGVRQRTLPSLAVDPDRIEIVSKGIARLIGQLKLYDIGLNADSSADDFRLNATA